MALTLLQPFSQSPPFGEGLKYCLSLPATEYLVGSTKEYLGEHDAGRYGPEGTSYSTLPRNF